jgi:hypothetical protein
VVISSQQNARQSRNLLTDFNPSKMWQTLGILKAQ